MPSITISTIIQNLVNTQRYTADLLCISDNNISKLPLNQMEAYNLIKDKNSNEISVIIATPIDSIAYDLDDFIYTKLFDFNKAKYGNVEIIGIFDKQLIIRYTIELIFTHPAIHTKQKK